MELVYPASLAVLAILAFIFWQNHNMMLLIVVIAIASYLIYSHETGNTATGFKNEMVESINSNAEDYGDDRGIKKFDPDKSAEEVR